MRCSCGVEVTYEWIDGSDGRDGGVKCDNGRICIDCETFTCHTCIVVAERADANYDDGLCVPCNRAYDLKFAYLCDSLLRDAQAAAVQP